MTDTYTINVTSESATTQNIFFFQQPVTIASSGTVYSASLLSSALRGEGSGSTLIYQQSAQNYAGASAVVMNADALSSPGASSGSVVALQAIAIQSDAANSTELLVDPLGLSEATNDPNVADGDYQIVTPTFDPSQESYDIGLAVPRNNQSPILSSFIVAEPSKNESFTPEAVFYVQIGSYAAGETFDFETAAETAAVCDATTGNTTFNVTYEATGTWTVEAV